MADLNKRYWLFTIEQYYPSGGLGDVRQTFDTIEEAEEKFQKIKNDEWGLMKIQIFDSERRVYLRNDEDVL